MGWFWPNNEINEKEDGELENISEELKQNLGELECEEEIMQDKEDFGRVRTNLMKVLRAKYGPNIANRTLSRVNKRIQEKDISSQKVFFDQLKPIQHYG